MVRYAELSPTGSETWGNLIGNPRSSQQLMGQLPICCCLKAKKFNDFSRACACLCVRGESEARRIHIHEVGMVCLGKRPTAAQMIDLRIADPRPNSRFASHAFPSSTDQLLVLQAHLPSPSSATRTAGLHGGRWAECYDRPPIGLLFPAAHAGAPIQACCSVHVERSDNNSRARGRGCCIKDESWIPTYQWFQPASFQPL